jgi:hypothetical protein
MTLDTDFVWALGEFAPGNKRLKAYRTFEAYYDGNQPLAFATKKYRGQFWQIFRGYSDNMCQSVVDVQAERLEVTGFTSSSAQATDAEVTLAKGPQAGTKISFSVVEDNMGDTAWDEWEGEGLPLVADQVHSDAFKYGDAFIIVDADGVWRQDPCEMGVRYSQEQPGVLEAAAKLWRDADNTVHLRIYREDGIHKFVSKEPQKASVKLTPAMFTGEGDVVELPQGMPVVHFANKVYGRYGISELAPVLPLQDALNKAEMDMIVAMEYQAFRQRWVSGVDVELDENGRPKAFPGAHGAGNLLAFSDPETKVGEFGAADLAPYVKVIENFRGQIARVSGIPPHYFYVGETGASQSGESLKVAESRFGRKGRRQQRCFGKVWEGLMDLVLEIANADGYESDVDLNAIWDETNPRSESEELDVLIKKQTIGVPNSQLQREAGYDPDEIEQFAVEYAENVKLGLQAPPQKNALGQNQTPGGTGQVGAPQSGGTDGISPANAD